MIHYKYVHAYRSNGAVYYYYRRAGRLIRLQGTPGTAAFQESYDAAAASFAASTPAPTARSDGLSAPRAGSLAALVRAYTSSTHFRGHEPSTQRQRRRVLERMCGEPVDSRSATSPLIGEMPLSRFDAAAVRALRDRREGTPEAARHLLKAVNQMFSWAIDEGFPQVTGSPVSGVRYPRSRATGGHTPWSESDVAAFERHHVLGSQARLFLALALNTGLRISDLARVGPKHEKDNSLHLTAYKNRNSKPQHLVLPILPALRRALDATETGATSFLLTDSGRPFASAAALGNKVRDWVQAAGLKNRSAHGLRKAAATILAERGATAHQLQAIFGWSTLKEAERYTRTAERSRLAAEGLPLMNAGMTTKPFKLQGATPEDLRGSSAKPVRRKKTAPRTKTG